MANPGSLENLMRFGYALILITVGLMIWASAVGASNPPCSFNSLCTCSNGNSDNLGNVECTNSPLMSLPDMLNISKIHTLKIDGTGLMDIEPFFLQATGIYRLEVINNPLFDLSEYAFYGLERTLRQLVLQANKLIDIPTKSIRYLGRLQHLDLSGNEIHRIERDYFRGQNALEELVLSDNSITIIPIDAFHGLPNLKVLDLSSNNLHMITPDVFREQMNSIEKVNFADNLLSEIPYSPLSMLKSIRYLDLSSNKISGFQIEAESHSFSSKLALDELHLEHNEINIIQPGSFQYILTANQTYLDFNPIHIINDNAFQSARIRELYIRHCNLDYIEPSAFNGLESSLQVLDLSGNNITTLPERLFSSFDLLGVINIKDNKLYSIFPQSVGFASFQSDLFKLDVSGERNSVINLQDLRKFDKIRILTIGKITNNQLSSNDLLGFGMQLESLRIVGAGLKAIKAHAFLHARGIKKLDFSDNYIDTIEMGAFAEIGHTLLMLKISHGLSSQITQFPEIRELVSLEKLDLSNNRLKSIGDTAFHQLTNLRVLELNDNQIEQMQKGLFQRDYHKKLEEVDLEFNSLRHISSHTFVDLLALQTIRLRDNKIERIEKGAFKNLKRLDYLSLRGNKLTSISEEAFENLPNLRLLDLSHNKLRSFDFDFLELVGSLSHLTLNISYNTITELNDNQTSFISEQDPCIIDFVPGSAVYHSNVKVLDLSHNNISRIVDHFFRPSELSLVRLNLAYNSLTNISKEVFGNFLKLQVIDFSNNFIKSIPARVFENTRKIQIIDFSQNDLMEISPPSFKNLIDLRIVDLSSNNLRSLPESFIVSDDLEKLDLSGNDLAKIPVNSLSNVAAMSLCDLNLSHNIIGATNNGTDTITLFSQRLSRLNLSYNRLSRLEDGAFATLPNLSVLDLSHNKDLDVYGRIFKGLENSLVELSLNNISLSQVPDLPLPHLRTLRIASNFLPSISPELSANFSNLRVLDFSNNDLTTVPLITHSLENLRSLSLAGNPITSLSNTSLAGPAETLEHLDIANLKLAVIEHGFLSEFRVLKSLRVSTYPDLSYFNIPLILSEVFSLKELIIESPAPRSVTVKNEGLETRQLVQDSASDLRMELYGSLPKKLSKITISGPGFNRLAEGIFDGVQSSTLHVTFFNTTLSGLPMNIFTQVGNVYNLSIDINSNNKRLNSLPNPHTAHYPNHPDKVFLNNLHLQYTSFTCDCDIGWIEFWQRKKRQVVCSRQDWSDDKVIVSKHEDEDDCEELYPDDDLRTVSCSNKNGEPLLEILKSELECGWNSAYGVTNFFILTGFAFSLILFLF